MSTKYIASNWRLPNQAGVDSYLNDNYGLTFSGSSEYIIVDSSTVLDNVPLNPYSFSFWFKSSTAGRVLSEKKDGGNFVNAQYTIHLESGYVKWYGGADGTGTQTSSTLVDDQWHHIACVAESTTVNKIYVDGQLDVTSSANRINSAVRTGTFNIGANFGGSYRLIGEISEFSIFDYALSSTQISTLYGSSLLGAGNPLALKPAPVAFYPLGDNSSGNPLTQPNEAVEDASVFDFLAAPTYSRISLGTTSFTGNKTISFWLNKGSNNGTVLGFGNTNYYPNVQSTTLQLNNGSTTTLSTGTINLNEWNHYVITGDGTTAKCYVNGVYKSTGTDRDISSGATWIGGQNNGTGMLLGKLSNVQQWETVLTDGGVSIGQTAGGEIAELYNSGVPLLTGTQPQASNLKAWYKLDQSANWEADTSGAWQIPDSVSAYPQSFNFDGSNDFIDLGTTLNSMLQLGDSFSVSAWINFGNTASDRTIVSNMTTSVRGFQFRVLSNEGIRIILAENGSTFLFLDSSSLAINTWHHAVFTYDGSNTIGGLNLYINSSLDNNTTGTSGTLTTITSTDSLKVGAYTSAHFFEGNISNVQIFNTVLPATGSNSVETLYNNGVPLTTAIATDNLKAWYKLNNTATFSTNWSIPDDSGNGNTGTSSGMTEQNLVNNNVSALNGESSGMTSANLVLTDLTRNLPYDSYSFNFDANASDYIDCGTGLGNSLTTVTNLTVSTWIKADITNGNDLFFNIGSFSNSWGKIAFQLNGDNLLIRINDNAYFIQKSYSSDVWNNISFVYDGSDVNKTLLYINGQEQTPDSSGGVYPSSIDLSGLKTIIGAGYNTPYTFDGKMSNVSIFNQTLTSTQVMKIYSNGMPQDLSTFTPAPVAWWTLGSNSFFNGSNFICKDLIGSNDGTSVNAGVDALQGNTPRSEANGTGSNMDIPTNLEGQTKYSSNNSWSINMSESARVADDTP